MSNAISVHDTDPGARARFRKEELQRFGDAIKRRQVFTVTPVEPIYAQGEFKAVLARLGIFMAVLPVSQIDKTVVDVESIIDRSLPVVVQSLPSRRSRMVLSHRTALEVSRVRLFKQLRVGQILEGVVDNVGRKLKDDREFGVFIDLGHKLTGLVHQSGLAGKLRPLSEHFRPGDAVTVEIVALRNRDRSGNRRIDLRLTERIPSAKA